MKVGFATLGCRVNQYETEAMAEKFIKQNYNIVKFEDFADVYVINTCTVTNMGDKKSRQMIHRAKRRNPNAIIAVVGCYSQIKPEEISKIDGVDIVLGTRNKGDIISSVNKVLTYNNKVVEVKGVLKNKVFEDLKIEEYQDRIRAFLKIQDGCNRFCSYCLIPFARGGVCSRSPQNVIDEVKRLANNGFKEIVLSGIHIASYGVDLDGNWDLLKMLEILDTVEGIERIRIGSIDPQFFSNGVVHRISSLKKLCHHFHLSLQSGCDETLRRMNRKYTTLEYSSIVNDLRKHMRDVSITTDVIVGFPGETEEEFNKTYNFLKRIKLSKMHIFKYSQREGTKAANMDNQIDGKIKDIRSKRLIKLNDINEEEFISRFKGKSLDVLYEQKLNNTEDEYEGYTSNYIKVISKSSINLQGRIISTEILRSNSDHANGIV
ncbi:tRNA (N(6)-L-threonylcarbamoyladenosine(37)-C(2))-methylthiotransferase MtaB [Clostridium fermenticellae]|uniref:Threonylcarbamoyladenosine tRNA methylthiotransferase MtaB n=1 Tax=Clostridium fermenticellae TaxID=2068654 RepID=A0A386H5J2_9CLOT|nr:tRNA (N(6)-L-threonylcarbamoyladenosine(37)-C(2))-methylthiotransferase MtaB [Clostridium fermenticellae]AYD40982.1 tRNA (N(6)-L-threonylcarbamoyladenosine(37)-C(2))-methylthiotransferase MtaB [Clostridium fermenticellae]